MRTLTAISFVLLAFIGACKQKEAVTVDLANVCSPDNEKKYISTTGFLTDRGSIFCSNIGGRMDCSLDIAAAANGDKVFSGEIEQGNRANQIAKIESSYKASDVKVSDNAGALVKLNDKVKLTGEMNVGGGTCFLEVDKVEKQ